MTIRNAAFAGITLVAVLVLVLVISGNRNSTLSAPTATPAAIAGPAAAATPTPALPLATGAIPPGVAKVVAAVITHQSANLEGLLAYQQVACTTAQGAGGPPKCKTGDAAGKVYRVFATGACEPEWIEDAGPALKQVVTTSGPLYAVAKLTPPTPDPDPSYPKGEAAVIFNAGTGGGGYFVVTGEQIVRVHTYCGAPAIETLLKGLGATAFYVAPQ